MIIAVPVTNNAPASYFSKAQCFSLYNERGELLMTEPNPIQGEDCHSKDLLFNYLRERDVKTLIVRSVGQRMLARLLRNKYQVRLLDNARQSIAEQVCMYQQLNLLTAAEQGRPSPSYLAKLETQQVKHCCQTTAETSSAAQAECKKGHSPCCR